MTETRTLSIPRASLRSFNRLVSAANKSDKSVSAAIIFAIERTMASGEMTEFLRS